MSKDSEIREIQRSYLVKRECLRQWRRREIDKINSRLDFKGAEVCPSQGDIEGGALSCTPISLVAVFNFLRKPEVDPRFIWRMNWKRIVENGVLIYDRWATMNNNSRVFFPFSEEIFNIEDLKPLRHIISLLKNTGGDLDDEKNEQCQETPEQRERTGKLSENQPNGWKYIEKSYYTLGESLAFLKGYPKSAATLTIRQATVSIFHCQGRYWLFDSHGIRSKLWECLDLPELEGLIRDKFPLLREFLPRGNKRVKLLHAETDNFFDFVLFGKN